MIFVQWAQDVLLTKHCGKLTCYSLRKTPNSGVIKVITEMPHVVLITPGQPSSNPRLLKEALALFKAGYKVTVIYCFWAAWADADDEKLFATFPGIQWIRVGGHPVQQKGSYWRTRVRRKLYSRISGIFPSSIYWLTRSIVRCGSGLISKAT